MKTDHFSTFDTKETLSTVPAWMRAVFVIFFRRILTPEGTDDTSYTFRRWLEGKEVPEWQTVETITAEDLSDELLERFFQAKQLLEDPSEYRVFLLQAVNGQWVGIYAPTGTGGPRLTDARLVAHSDSLDFELLKKDALDEMREQYEIEVRRRVDDVTEATSGKWDYLRRKLLDDDSVWKAITHKISISTHDLMKAAALRLESNAAYPSGDGAPSGTFDKEGGRQLREASVAHPE